jgi:cytochrome c-type biogenesis protein CcmH
VKVLLLSFFAVVSAGVGASQDVDAAARRLEGKLMAPCCWTQTVSHHYSPAADQMRKGIREKLSSGLTEEQILEAYVAEYGERILASPRARGFNILAYVLPGAFAILGVGVLILALRRFMASGRAAVAAVPLGDAPVSDAYAARIERELRDED